MSENDIRQMIERCIAEITQLRGQVAQLQPRADAYVTVEKILGLLPQQSQGYGEDIVWRLKKQLDELQPKVAEVGEQ